MVKDIGNVKYFSEDDLRFATPIDVANFRAKRLRCKVIVDLCSGIGIQSGAFAKVCKEVYGFEIDERKVQYAKKNFEVVKNLKFEVGNVLEPSVIEKVRQISPDIIFCDPERLAQEKERNLESIQPNLRKLIEIYSKITPNICLEIPPQIEIEKLNELGDTEKSDNFSVPKTPKDNKEVFGFEAEYLSVGNKLNRLDLYFGDLKKAEVSVVDVNGERITRGISSLDESKKNSKFASKEVNKSNENLKDATKAVKTNKLSRYVYEISTAIVKAGLENEFAREISGNILEGCEKNKILISSDRLDNKFKSLCRAFEVIGVGNNYVQVMDILKKFKLGKVVIKYSVDPKDYWKERNRYENSLKGRKEAVLFLINNRYVVCEEV